MVSFLFVLGVLVFVHELGHFLVAKKVGIKVERFSLGFPPYIFNRRVGETDYSIGIIPLGGFVKMPGENPDDPGSGDGRDFSDKTVGQRAAVIIAGPLMNYLLAIVLFIGVAWLSSQPTFKTDSSEVGEILAGSPAERAGLLSGDKILSVNGVPVASYDSLSRRINAVVADTVRLQVVRGTDTVSIAALTELSTQPNIKGGLDTIGRIGVRPALAGYTNYSFPEAVAIGFNQTNLIAWETLLIAKRLVTFEASLKAMGGPVFIARQAGAEAKRGIDKLFFFMALLSVNLAVLNLLPIPILDGGHLVFLAVEKIKGSPVSMKVRGIAQQVGMAMLLALIVAITYNDIMRLFV